MLEHSEFDIGSIGRAKTHCPAGHELSEANTMRRKDGRRRCLICHRKDSRDSARRARERNGR
jgi:hypothetical protein